MTTVEKVRAADRHGETWEAYKLCMAGTGMTRCELCKGFRRRYNSNLRMRRKLGQVRSWTGKRAPHGTLTRYNDWGCKCTPCKVAEKRYRRDHAADA